MPRRAHLGAFLLTLALASACAAPTPTATPPPAAPAAKPTTAPAASPTPANVAKPTLAGAAAAPAATQTSRPAESADAALRWELGEGSEARFRVREQLAGRSLPNEVVGKTNAVTGSIAVAADGRVVPELSKIVVDLTGLTTDETRRDNYVKRNTLQTSRFPNAELVVREAQGLPWPLPASGETAFRLVGDLTVHGVTRPTTWDVTARLADGAATGTARTTIRLEDFGMTRPVVGPVLSIEETLALELEFQAARAA